MPERESENETCARERLRRLFSHSIARRERLLTRESELIVKQERQHRKTVANGTEKALAHQER